MLLVIHMYYLKTDLNSLDRGIILSDRCACCALESVCAYIIADDEWQAVMNIVRLACSSPPYSRALDSPRCPPSAYPQE